MSPPSPIITPAPSFTTTTLHKRQDDNQYVIGYFLIGGSVYDTTPESCPKFTETTWTDGGAATWVYTTYGSIGVCVDPSYPVYVTGCAGGTKLLQGGVFSTLTRSTRDCSAGKQCTSWLIYSDPEDREPKTNIFCANATTTSRPALSLYRATTVVPTTATSGISTSLTPGAVSGQSPVASPTASLAAPATPQGGPSSGGDSSLGAGGIAGIVIGVVGLLIAIVGVYINWRTLLGIVGRMKRDEEHWMSGALTRHGTNRNRNRNQYGVSKADPRSEAHEMHQDTRYDVAGNSVPEMLPNNEVQRAELG